MSTDATGLPSPGAQIVGQSLDKAVETAATAGARSVRSLDDRLTLLSVRMTYVALSFFFACFKCFCRSSQTGLSATLDRIHNKSSNAGRTPIQNIARQPIFGFELNAG